MTTIRNWIHGNLVDSIDVYLVNLEQDTPYLGNLREGESINERGYFVRRGNRTVYPRKNRSLVVRLTCRDGREGWGETYGLVAPKATAAIIYDLFSCFVIGKDPEDRDALHDELYDLMRVRGYSGGFYVDALAAVDIALWDLAGKQQGVSVSELLGGCEQQFIPAYVSGLPKDTLAERCEFALEWRERGFDSFKFALPAADHGAAEELTALRKHLGPDVRIAADLHWAFTPEEAVALAHEMVEQNPWFLEAPVAPEDIDGLQYVAAHADVPIAAGEEWRTRFEALHRISRGAVDIVQPEMGHTGITQFQRIARLAHEHGLPIMPHATIGAGLFLSASLHAAAALPGVLCHEYQHSLLDPFQHYTGNVLRCESGRYHAPPGPGIGVEPSEAMRANMTRMAP